MTKNTWLWMFLGTLGGVSVQTLWPSTHPWTLVLLGLFMAWLLLMTEYPKAQSAGWLGLFFLLGMASMQMHQTKEQQWMQAMQINLRKATVLDVKVLTHPALYADYAKLKIRVVASDVSTSVVGQNIQLQMRTYQHPKRGDQIRVRGRIHMDTWLGESHLRMNVARDEDWVLLKASNQYWHTLGPQIKNIFSDYASGTPWMIHRALSMGEGQALPDAIKGQLKDMGIIHLFVFSGFHVGVLFFIFSSGLQIIARLVTLFRPHRSINMHAYVLALLATCVYVFLFVRWSLPTLRALVFLAIGLICYARGWPVRPLQWLCIGLTFFLLVDPTLLQSPSALLSFFAVTGIVWTMLLTKQTNQKKPSWKNKILYWTQQNAYIALAAFTWTAPVLIFFFQKANLMSVVYNFLLVPTFGSLMIALSIFNNLWAMIFHGSMGLSYGIALQEWVTFLFLDTASFLQKMASATIQIEKTELWWVVAFYGCLIISYAGVGWQKNKSALVTRIS